MTQQKMTYSSLEEVWNSYPFQSPQLYNKTDSFLPQIPDNYESHQNDNILKDRDLSEYKLCDDQYFKFSQHLKSCENCRKKILNELSPNNIQFEDKKKVIENFSLNNDTSWDIVIIILFGIFLLFILDGIFKLGKFI